jgi:hypothetical protein
MLMVMMIVITDCYKRNNSFESAVPSAPFYALIVSSDAEFEFRRPSLKTTRVLPISHSPPPTDSSRNTKAQEQADSSTTQVAEPLQPAHDVPQPSYADLQVQAFVHSFPLFLVVGPSCDLNTLDDHNQQSQVSSLNTEITDLKWYGERCRQKTRQDKTRQDKARQDTTRQDKTRHDTTRQGKTRQSETRHDTTRQDDKTRRDEVRRDETR